MGSEQLSPDSAGLVRLGPAGASASRYQESYISAYAPEVVGNTWLTFVARLLRSQFSGQRLLWPFMASFGTVNCCQRLKQISTELPYPVTMSRPAVSGCTSGCDGLRLTYEARGPTSLCLGLQHTILVLLGHDGLASSETASAGAPPSAH